MPSNRVQDRAPRRAWGPITIFAFVVAMGLVYPANSQAAWTGTLEVVPAKDKVKSGQLIEVDLNAVQKRGKQSISKDVTDREASFALVPSRWNLFTDEPITLEATHAGDGRYRVQLPEVPAGWYRVYAGVADDLGRLDPIGKILRDQKTKNRAGFGVIAVTGDGSTGLARVHTERARCVYSPGEEVRLYVSSPTQGPAGQAKVTLVPRDENAGLKPMLIAEGQAAAGKTTIYDLPSKLSSAIAPGDYEMVLSIGGQAQDRWAVRFVSAERPGGGTRAYHGGPWGQWNARSVNPWEQKGWNGWIGRSMTRAYQANHWINVFHGTGPVVGPDSTGNLPHAGEPGLPPVVSQSRPAYTHALWQALMAEGASISSMFGGSELGSENYMPVPMNPGPEMDIMTRRYLAAALGYQQFPNFTGLYTDAYAKPDWHGGGELTGDESNRARQTMWANAWAHAGLKQTPEPPYRFIWGGKDLNKFVERNIDKQLLRDKLGKKWADPFQAYVKDLVATDYDGNINRLKDAPQAEQLRHWRRMFTQLGFEAVEPNRSYPFPKLSGIGDDVADQTQRYRYTEYVQSGFGRLYGQITETVEDEMPAVFTIHNRRRENHRDVGYAWRDWSRSPSVPPEYSFGGPTTVISSEFNLDSEPQPYSNPTQYLQPNVDKGQPVWASANGFQRAGSQSRIMRDAVFFSGRGVTPVYHSPSNPTWSHRGSDQSTYAAFDRTAMVNRFLNTHEDLFAQLAPVKEVGLYMGPYWAGPNSYGSYVAIPSALMSGHQVHILSHTDADKGGFDQYQVILAPGLPRAPVVPHIRQAFDDFVKRGGKIIGTPAATRYYGFDDAGLAKYGISYAVEPVLDKNGKQRFNRDGSPKTRTVWKETPEQRARITRDYVWQGFPDNAVNVLPIDLRQRWGRIDPETGEKAGWYRHWTGHGEWGEVQTPALAHHKTIKAALDAVNDPLVKKSEPEVFVSAAKPRGESSGLYLFAANFKIPDGEHWRSVRIPWLFFPTYAEPVACQLKVKGEGVGAVYELVSGQRVPFEREGDRVVFNADLGSVEGRVFALLPAPIAGGSLQVEGNTDAGRGIAIRYQRLDDAGNVLNVMGSVNIQVLTESGRVLVDLNRAVSPGQPIPLIQAPGNIEGKLVVRVTDLLTGMTAEQPTTITPNPAVAAPASAVTVYRGDRLHQFFKETRDKGLRIVVDSGQIEIKDGQATVKSANSSLREDRAFADQIAKSLRGQGITASVVETKDAVIGPMRAYPYNGSRAGYRGFHTVPNIAIEGPVLFVGNPDTSPTLSRMDRAGVTGRSLSGEQTSQGRAVIGWQPKAFSATDDAVVIAASDNPGQTAAAETLTAIISNPQDPDTFYTAREQTRFRWLGADIERYKIQRRDRWQDSIAGAIVNRPASPAIKQPPTAKASAQPDWRGLEDQLGPHVFALDAGPNGIAVATTSLVRPLVLLSPDGEVRMSAGGGAEVFPRDVAVSADGNTAMAGFALIGITSAYDASGNQRWTHTSGITAKDNPMSWDTFKSSERFLGVSPDKKTVVISAGPDGVLARDTGTGQQLWSKPSFAATSRPRGAVMQEIAFSPEGKYVLIQLTEKLGEEAKKDKKGNPVTDESGQAIMLPVTKLWNQLVETRTGRLVWQADANASDWEMYNSVGPEGAWTITGGRSAKAALRGPKGRPLRILTGTQLPSGLSVGKQIAPEYLSAGNAGEVLAYAPQGYSLYVMEVTIGTESDIDRAVRLSEQNQQIIKTVNAKLNDKKSYKQWSSEHVDAFMSSIDAPEDAKRLLGNKMKRVPAELRAKRKRDARWMSHEFNEFKKALFEQDRKAIEAAANLATKKQVRLPDMIVSADINADGTIAYVGLWDQTVRAYNLRTGEQLWSTPVNGGARVDVVDGKTLYAGGSRADIYRIDAQTGDIIWHTNITEASSSTLRK